MFGDFRPLGKIPSLAAFLSNQSTGALRVAKNPSRIVQESSAILEEPFTQQSFVLFAQKKNKIDKEEKLEEKVARRIRKNSLPIQTKIDKHSTRGEREKWRTRET